MKHAKFVSVKERGSRQKERVQAKEKQTKHQDYHGA